MDMSDLDLACEILDEARHAVAGTSRTILHRCLEGVLFGTEPNRLMRDWQQRKRAVADVTPASVLIHQHGLERT